MERAADGRGRPRRRGLAGPRGRHPERDRRPRSRAPPGVHPAGRRALGTPVRSAPSAPSTPGSTAPASPTSSSRPAGPRTTTGRARRRGRRHRPAARRRRTSSGRCRRRLVPRSHGLRRPHRASTATGSACSPSSRSSDEHGVASRCVADETWRGGFGAVRAASLYDGTTIDLPLETPAGTPGFDDAGWIAAPEIDVDPSVVRTAHRRRRCARSTSCRWRRVRPDRMRARRRPEHRRLGAPGRAGIGGRPRHRAARRGPRARRATCTPPSLRTAKATDVYVLGRRRRARARAGLHVPRLPVRRA